MNQASSTTLPEEQKMDWEQVRANLQEQLVQARKELKEINLMLEQSQVEIGRLTQRNASATGELQRVQLQFDTMPREDIKNAYEVALESQQRLFLMRGHLEKMVSDQKHLQRELALLEFVSSLPLGSSLIENQTRNSAVRLETLEMMINAQETERQRLSRQMHDGPAQALSNLLLQAEIATRLFEIDKDQAYQEIGVLKDSTMATFELVRDFIFEMRPMMLDDLGLVPTVQKYCSAFKEQNGIELALSVTGIERRLEPYLEVMIFRAIQELLGNVATHSQAGKVKVQLHMGETSVQAGVEDDGKGIDLAVTEIEKGMGLKIIKERVEMLGGTFKLDSRPGEGTQVTFSVPTAGYSPNE
jgi:two-component system sensor histidine kinase DegS